MAGQPKKRAMVEELEKRAKRAECSVMDYVEQWIADAKTIKDLALSISDSTKKEIGRGQLSRYLNDLDGAEGRIARARLIGAHALIDDAIEIADEATEDDVQAARLRVQTRQWVAERWNSKEMGQQKGTNVHISIGQLHLDALRQPLVHAPVIATVIEQQPSDNALESGEEAQDVVVE